MNIFAKSVLVLGAIGTVAFVSAMPSAADDSGYTDGPAYAQPVQYDPAFAYTGDPAYNYRRYGRAPGYGAYGYAPGYGAYAYSPGYGAYAYAPGYRGYYRGHVETRSVPRHYDPGAGYNSNTVAPWQDWKYQGHDY